MSTGDHSIAIGTSALTGGFNGIAIGKDSSALANTVAIGHGATATQSGIAIGRAARATENQQIILNSSNNSDSVNLDNGFIVRTSNTRGLVSDFTTVNNPASTTVTDVLHISLFNSAGNLSNFSIPLISGHISAAP